MGKPKRLAWGKSPFDDMDPDELLFWARRMYAVCTEARSVMALCHSADPWSSFWSLRGSGGDALVKANTVVEEIERRFDHESIYRSFYRYAVDLLFGPSLGVGWHICTVEGCGQMTGRGVREVQGAQPVPRCPSHRETPMRPITWEDLSPDKAVR